MPYISLHFADKLHPKFAKRLFIKRLYITLNNGVFSAARYFKIRKIFVLYNK